MKMRRIYDDDDKLSKPKKTSYRNDNLDDLPLTTPPPVPVPNPSSPPALALAFRILVNTSLQYLSLSTNRCWNFACSASADGGCIAIVITSLNVYRVNR